MRREIAVALARNIPVIPVLVDDAEMPSPQDLPTELRPLVRRSWLELRDESWQQGLARLISALEHFDWPDVGMAQPDAEPEAAPPSDEEASTPVQRWWSASCSPTTRRAVGSSFALTCRARTTSPCSPRVSRLRLQRIRPEPPYGLRPNRPRIAEAPHVRIQRIGVKALASRTQGNPEPRAYADERSISRPRRSRSRARLPATE